MCKCVCVKVYAYACPFACERVCVRARACERACVRVCMHVRVRISRTGDFRLRSSNMPSTNHVFSDFLSLQCHKNIISGMNILMESGSSLINLIIRHTTIEFG